ncbi:hypothetical protein B0H14DRAFT_2637660 [Mycena olivaceomarginata]|nr:hypothetical protein B0H14DRAFT_2637660 [Mycena olivaceomarginata]
MSEARSAYDMSAASAQGNPEAKWVACRASSVVRSSAGPLEDIAVNWASAEHSRQWMRGGETRYHAQSWGWVKPGEGMVCWVCWVQPGDGMAGGAALGAGRGRLGVNGVARYLKVLLDKENVVLIGTTIDELVRHHPSLKAPVFDALKATLSKIEVLGLQVNVPLGTIPASDWDLIRLWYIQCFSNMPPFLILFHLLVKRPLNLVVHWCAVLLARPLAAVAGLKTSESLLPSTMDTVAGRDWV